MLPAELPGHPRELGGRAGVPLPPVQPWQALLAMAERSVRPGPSGTVTKLASQARGRGQPDFTAPTI